MSISSPLAPRVDPAQLPADDAVLFHPEIVADSNHRTGPEDGRSSSLSDLGNGKDHDLVESPLSERLDGNDTEAETERLDESPEKIRKQQNVVLTSAATTQNRAVENCASVNGESNGNVKLYLNGAAPITSDISSLGDSDSGHLTPSPVGSPSRKRKRSEYESKDAIRDTFSTPKREGSSLSEQQSSPRHTYQHETSKGTLEEPDFSDESHGEDEESAITNASARRRFPKSKHKERKKEQSAEGATNDGGDEATLIASIEGVESHEEDVAPEEVDDAAEADITHRNEEILLKKKAATKSLGNINRFFSVLTDKLYAEKLARLDHELEVLQRPEPTHPELLAAMKVIDQHRDDKIRYEIVRRKHKMQCLQKKSVAEKAQLHSHHQQLVRDIRERHVEQLNREQSQIQHERRDLGVMPYAKSFPVKRSQQIRHQQAYNLQVSLLSGVAKHTGFPAAPDLQSAKPAEAEEDMAFIRSLHPALDPRRGSLSAISSLQRQRANTDEQRFLEQTPWANPQHPAHTQPHNHSRFSQPQSPTITPVVQRRIMDSSALQESGSTIPEAQSGPSSSIAPTPVTGDVGAGPIRTFRNFTPSRSMDPTPSKQIAPPSSYTFLESGAKRGSGKRHPVHVDGESPIGGTTPQRIDQSDVATTQSVRLNPQFSYSEVKLEERSVHGLYGQHPTVIGASTVT